MHKWINTLAQLPKAINTVWNIFVWFVIVPLGMLSVAYLYFTQR